MKSVLFLFTLLTVLHSASAQAASPLSNEVRRVETALENFIGESDHHYVFADSNLADFGYSDHQSVTHVMYAQYKKLGYPKFNINYLTSVFLRGEVAACGLPPIHFKPTVMCVAQAIMIATKNYNPKYP